MGKNHRTMQFFVYKVDVDDLDASNIATSEEDDLEHLTWFARSELSSVKLTPPSITLFKRLGYID